MAQRRSITVDCPKILSLACFEGVSETTISALKRRTSELDIALGHEVYLCSGEVSDSDNDGELGLWYVAEGGLRIVAYSTTQTCEVSIALLHPGTIFGSLSTLSAIDVEEDWL